MDFRHFCKLQLPIRHKIEHLLNYLTQTENLETKLVI